VPRISGKLSAFAVGVAARFPGDTLEPVLISGGETAPENSGWAMGHGFPWDFPYGIFHEIFHVIF